MGLWTKNACNVMGRYRRTKKRTNSVAALALLLIPISENQEEQNETLVCFVKLRARPLLQFIAA
jgi:hypothetical protein